MTLNCPPGSITGDIVNNSQAYISNITPSVSAFATGSSYLSEADVILGTERLADLGGLTSTGCIYYVGVFISGLCNAGDLHDSYALSGSSTNSNAYLAYLTALTTLYSQTGSACTT